MKYNYWMAFDIIMGLYCPHCSHINYCGSLVDTLNCNKCSDTRMAPIPFNEVEDNTL